MSDKMYQGLLTRSSLGRLGLIGELYDVRTESFSSRSLLKSTHPKTLIQSREMGQMEFDFKFTENISDRFEMLNVEAELQLSILLGIINLTGSGKFLSEDKKSQKTVSCSLICKLLNVTEKLFASFEEIVPYIDLNSLLDPNFTHVVVEVNWGANCLLSLESTCDSCEEKQVIEGTLGGELKKLKALLSVGTSGNLKKQDMTALQNKDIRIKICADVIPDVGWPTTVEGFCQFVLELPKLVKKVNNGKGKPLNYVMIPLATLRKLASLKCDIEVIDRKIDESFIMSTVYFFEEVLQTKQKFHDVLEKMSENKKYVANDMLKKTKKHLENLLIKESELKSLISEDWLSVKSGEKNLKDLIRRVEKFKNHDFNLLSYDDFLDSCNPTLEKITTVKNYISKGIIYLGQGEKLEAFMANELNFEFVAFVISSEIEKDNPELYKNTWVYFLSLASEPRPATKYVVIDFDFNPEEKFLSSEIIINPKIYHLKGSQILSSDLYSEYLEDITNNYAQLGQGLETDYIQHKPGNRVVLEIRCPGFEAGTCTPDPLKWYCFRCKSYLEYGFDELFYCLCGRGTASAFEYRCSNIKHGSSFIPFRVETLNKVLSTLRPLKELNLLVLGQSGVGKSTWINSIINYLTYNSLENAQENGVICTIPMNFVMYDAKTLKKHDIKVGEVSENEVTEMGESATQRSHTYNFLWEGRCVRIIDTPGLGDTRGIDQDKENLKNIIEHIGYLKELHGVCILFRANDNRITSYFSYCLKELLVHLHRSVARNIVFCFTNARSSLYSPGQTSAILEKVIDSLGVGKELALGHHNMFCLDNEALLFLCSLQNSEINHDETLVKSFAQSWEISLKETRRLFNTVKTFEPHLLKETISLVTARSRVLTLTKPLAEISKTIQMNVAAAERKQKEISDSELAIEELSKKLNYIEIHLLSEPLQKPRTVCTSSTCIEYINLKSLNVNEILYKTHCHVECYLRDVTPKTVNNALLQGCQAMSNGKCKVCGCGWEKHMHLTYSQRRIPKNVVNKTVEKDMLKEKTEKEKIEKFVTDLKATIEKYKREQEFIIQTCVKFGMFLRKNAISLYNDSVEDYLSYLIQSEETKPYKSEDEELVLEKLRDTLEQYKCEINIINEVLQKGENVNEELTVEDIYDLEQQLYKLELTGKDIQKSVEISRSTNNKMMEYSETPLQLNSKRKKNTKRFEWNEACKTFKNYFHKFKY